LMPLSRAATRRWDLIADRWPKAPLPISSVSMPRTRHSILAGGTLCSMPGYSPRGMVQWIASGGMDASSCHAVCTFGTTLSRPVTGLLLHDYSSIDCPYRLGASARGFGASLACFASQTLNA
jgi:hypothetical protein